MIVSLKRYFDRNKKSFSIKDSSVQMVADAFDIGSATVHRIMADYNKNPENLYRAPRPKGRPEQILGLSQQEVVRSHVRAANLEGRPVTLESLKELLEPEFGEQFHITTLARTLDRWGFEFGKGTRTQHLKEKDHIVAARQRYLRRMRANRNSDGSLIRPEIYLDESYVNKNHSNDFTWYFGEDGPWIQKPTGSGDRLIIMNAISKDGWVPGAKNVFKSSKKTGDYHGQMNAGVFQRWFREMLLPNIPKNSLIILDNAPYHNVLSASSAPTGSCSIQKIEQWLLMNKIPCNPDCLKAELVEILAKIAPEPTYVIDEIAREFGHEIARTPPYHPELQPIEICWGIVKNEVARNCDFTMKNLETQLEHAFSKVSPETCDKVIQKIRQNEEKFWREGLNLERNMAFETSKTEEIL